MIKSRETFNELRLEQLDLTKNLKLLQINSFSFNHLKKRLEEVNQLLKEVLEPEQKPSFKLVTLYDTACNVLPSAAEIGEPVVSVVFEIHMAGFGNNRKLIDRLETRELQNTISEKLKEI